MAERIFSISRFLQELEDICKREQGVSLPLRIDNTKSWPHFSISDGRQDTPPVRGYFVENGASYWQISHSGREAFTGDDRSSADFIEQMRIVIHVLVTVGCTETRWKDEAGVVVRSVIKIDHSGKEIVFGKAPHFWGKSLTEERVDFAPLRLAPRI